MPLLEARAVSKRFGGLTALNTVDFTLEEGHIASIIGPNGAGKTTFFNVFTGIYVPEEGVVTFRGTPVLGRRPDEITALGICRTFQNIRLFPRMTAIENVLVGMHSRVPLTFLDVITGTSAGGHRRGAGEHGGELSSGRTAGQGQRDRANPPRDSDARVARALVPIRRAALDEPPAGGPGEAAALAIRAVGGAPAPLYIETKCAW